jgi:hypothetical protein
VVGDRSGEGIERLRLAPRGEIGVFVGETGGGDTLQALGFEPGDHLGQLVVGLLARGERCGRGGQGLSGGSIVGLGGGPRVFEIGEVALRRGQSRGQFVGVAQLGRHMLRALLEHGSNTRLVSVSGGAAPACCSDGPVCSVSGVACRVAGLPQGGDQLALGEHVGLGRQVAGGYGGTGVLGGAADGARRAGGERRREHGRLALRPSGLERGEVGRGTLGGYPGGVEHVARLALGQGFGPLGGRERSAGGRGCGLCRRQIGGLVRHGGELAHLVGEVRAPRLARGLGGEGGLGRAPRGLGPLEAGLGELELQQARREVVAAVVHRMVELGQRRGRTRELDLGSCELDLRRLACQRVGFGLRLAELVESGGDCLRRRERGEGRLFGRGGRGGRRLGCGGLLARLRQPLAELVWALDRGRPEDRRSVGRGLAHVAFDRLGLVFELLLQVAVALGAKQALEDLLAVLAARLEELLELALRQHDHLPELDAAKAEDLLDSFVDVGGLGGERRALGVGVVGGYVGAVPQGRARGLGGEAVAVLLGARLQRAAAHAVALVADGEVELHLGA